MKLQRIAYSNYKYNIDDTRYEEEVKSYISSEINYLVKKRDYTKLKYLYYEWYNKKNNDMKSVIKDLKNILKIDYSNKHDNLFDIIKLSNSM